MRKHQRAAAVHIQDTQLLVERVVDERPDHRVGGVVDEQAHCQASHGALDHLTQIRLAQVRGQGANLDGVPGPKISGQMFQHVRPARDQDQVEAASR